MHNYYYHYYYYIKKVTVIITVITQINIKHLFKWNDGFTTVTQSTTNYNYFTDHT